MSEDKKARTFLISGVSVLILQNFIIFFESIFKYSDDEYIWNQLQAVYNKSSEWSIDILGFALLAIAFYLHALKEGDSNTGKKLRIASASFAGWVILRIMWQYFFMPDVETQLLDSFDTDTSSDLSFDASVSIFLIASVLLLVAGIFMYQLGSRNILFLIYTAINLLSAFFIFINFHSSTTDLSDSLIDANEQLMDILTFRLKFLLIPLLALPAFYKMADTELRDVFNELKTS